MLRILLDENIDLNLKKFIPAQNTRHVTENGWEGLSDHELMATATANGAHVLITAGRNLPYDESMAGHSFALVVLDIHPNTLSTQVACTAEIIRLLEKMRMGNVYLIIGPHTARSSSSKPWSCLVFENP